MAPNDDFSFSRRDFLKTVGVGGLATSVIGGEAEAQTGLPARGRWPGRSRHHAHHQRPTARTSGRAARDAARCGADETGPDRTEARLRSGHLCGACTMIVDGRTVYSCSTLAIEMQGKQIRTVEGLAQGNTLHPVQQAFCDRDGMMCGFCTPGFIMATVALLERNPNPTPAQARRALDGNICRCGTHVRVVEAALSAKGVTRG